MQCKFLPTGAVILFKGLDNPRKLKSMSIEKSLFSSVILIRQKKAEGKKLEKHEKEWYTKNKNLVDMKKRRTAEEQAEMDALLKWLK